MKLILEENDGKREEAFREEVKAEPNTLRLVRAGNKYSVSFEILDEARANNFIGNILLANACGNKPEMEELMGIKCTSLNFDKVQPKIEQLREMIDQFALELKELQRSNV